MNLQEATIKALQGKLTEGLDFEVDNKWIPYDKNDPERIDKYIQQIIDTNKPVKYSYIAGYDNWTAITETKNLSIDEVRDLFLKSGEEYRVYEKDDYIAINRIENRW